MYASRSSRRLALTAAVFLTAVQFASAQSSGSSGGSGGSSGSSMGGSSGGITTISGSGSTSGQGGSSQSAAPASRTQQQGFTGGVQQGFIQTTTTGGGNVGSSGSGFNATSSSSPVAQTYANPLYSGKPGAAANQTGVRVGGFGSNLYTWNAPNQQNVLGRVTNALQGQNANHNNMNVSTQAGRRVAAYTSAVKFRHPTPTPAQVHAQARATIASTTSLPSAPRIQVLLDGSTLVLRGKVTDDDERRLAENVLRLTPGVRDIRNELGVDGLPSAASSQSP